VPTAARQGRGLIEQAVGKLKRRASPREDEAKLCVLVALTAGFILVKSVNTSY
jgi:hypothetical protein